MCRQVDVGTDPCVNMCVGMCPDMRTDMCPEDVCVHPCVNMCTDMCKDVRKDVRTDMRIDVCAGSCTARKRRSTYWCATMHAVLHTSRMHMVCSNVCMVRCMVCYTVCCMGVLHGCAAWHICVLHASYGVLHGMPWYASWQDAWCAA